MTNESPCHVCESTVPVDGEHAIQRFNNTLCRDCSGKAVVFEATCDSELCEWSHRVEGTEFNRGHLEVRIQQEANQHREWKRVFEDNPCHTTTIVEASDSQ